MNMMNQAISTKYSNIEKHYGDDRTVTANYYNLEKLWERGYSRGIKAN
jgi:hypothetical protein